MENLINQNTDKLKKQIEDVIKELHDTCIDIGHLELGKTISELRERIHEPFMFVIVGEVKAGKSSFINALLDTEKEICKVAASPMTDTIQQIIYGEKEEIVEINPYLKRIYQPVDILKTIAIVDTPGTNTIVAHHQEITEKFIPASDLIVFVFEAKNPYRQSAWAFFDFIHADWKKKIIFVLQQKDLMNEEDLEVNINGVHEYALKKGISEPNVFAVSAKMEQEDQKLNSGFKDVRTYIESKVTGGRASILKLSNNTATAHTIHDRIQNGLDDRIEQFQADLAFRQDISDSLSDQTEKSKKQVDILIENLIAAYDRITLKYERSLSEGISFFGMIKRSFASIFNKKKSVKNWLEQLAIDLETELNAALKEKLNDGVIDLASSIQSMAKIIDLKLRTSQTILKNNHDVFSDIADKRNSVLHELREAFAEFLAKGDNFDDQSILGNHKDFTPNLVTGSGLAVIGVIITAVTNGVVFDISGGILTTIGLIFAGASVGIKKKKLIKAYREEIEKGRSNLVIQLEEKLKKYVENIRSKIDQNFDHFDVMLNQEEEQIGKLVEKQETIVEKLYVINEEINQLSNKLDEQQ